MWAIVKLLIRNSEHLWKPLFTAIMKQTCVFTTRSTVGRAEFELSSVQCQSGGLVTPTLILTTPPYSLTTPTPTRLLVAHGCFLFLTQCLNSKSALLCDVRPSIAKVSFEGCTQIRLSCHCARML